MKKTAFWTVALALALFGTASRADVVPVGECGGQTFYDDAQLDFRSFIMRPDPAGRTDLNAPGVFAQALWDNCLKVIAIFPHQSADGSFDCAVLLAAPVANCTKSTASKSASYQNSSIGTESDQSPSAPPAPRE